jgi:dihydroxy-acid dehydratase
VGGPLALVRTGDRIRLDVEARRIDLLVSDDELASRRAALPPTTRPDWAKRGYARLLHDTVMQADQGCDFDFMMGVGNDQAFVERFRPSTARTSRANHDPFSGERE